MLILTPGGPVHDPRRQGPDPAREQARKRAYDIMPLTSTEAAHFIEQWHYARGVGRLTASFALRRRDCGSVVGVAGFNPPSLGAAKLMAAGQGRHQDVIGLSRLCYAPDAPHNAGSLLLGAAIRALPERWAIVATYADEGAGVRGVTYQASNFRYLGTSVPRPIWTRGGVQVSVQRGKTSLTHAEMLEDGCVLQGRARMHRYRFVRGHSEERRAAPYPQEMPRLLREGGHQ